MGVRRGYSLKKMLILGSILMGEFLFAQFNYKVEIKLNEFSLETGDNSLANIQHQLALRSIDQSIPYFFAQIVNGVPTDLESLNVNKVITLNKEANQLYEFSEQSQFIGEAVECIEDDSSVSSFNDFTCHAFFMSTNACVFSNIAYARIYRIEPLYTVNNISNTNNIITDCEPYSFKIANINCNSTLYELLYILPDGTKKILLPYGQNPVNIDLNFSDFDELSLGDNLNLQVRYTNNQNETDVFSDIVTFSTISCSPQLLDFQEQDTTCSYTSDGSFSMILDRDLGANKKLVASLFYEFIPNTFSLLAQKDTTILVDNGNGTFTYNWPTDTPILPGRYKVRYQTFDTSTPNPVWDSLEGTEDGFEIGNPPPVTFDGAILNQVFCHDGNDAKIRLEANGGVGNYEYQINSGSWIPFTNTSMNTTHIINSLNKGEKNIKVKDGNGCTEKI